MWKFGTVIRVDWKKLGYEDRIAEDERRWMVLVPARTGVKWAVIPLEQASLPIPCVSHWVTMDGFIEVDE